MIDEDRMIIGEVLTLIMIVAGTNAGATRRRTATMTDLRGPMEITDGHAEVAMVLLEVTRLELDRTRTFSKTLLTHPDLLLAIVCTIQESFVLVGL